MKGLFPIIRRPRRPLLPPDEPQQRVVIPVTVEPGPAESVQGSTADPAVPCGDSPHGTPETDEPSKGCGQPAKDLAGEPPARTGGPPAIPGAEGKELKGKTKHAPAQAPTDAA